MPGPGSQFIDLGRTRVLSLVLGDAVQGVDVHIEYILVFVDQLDGLLDFSVHIDLFQSPEYPYPMIHMHHIIARVETNQFLDRYRFLLTEAVMKPELVIALKDLVVGVEALPQVMVCKSFMEGLADGFVL